jgi:glutamine amidotransferase
MIAIIDYGVGNLYSLESSFRSIGADTLVTSSPEDIRKADKLVLPGVGAFSDAIAKLKATGLDLVICDEVRAGKEILGICLGMQMLFEKSYEYGEYDGLGLLRGSVVPISSVVSKEYKIPHIGWNALHIQREHKLLRYVSEGDCVYFVHSFCASDCDDSLLATAEYGCELTASVAKGNIMGCQFHPEKSGKVGLSILRAFCEETSV